MCTYIPTCMIPTPYLARPSQRHIHARKGTGPPAPRSSPLSPQTVAKACLHHQRKDGNIHSLRSYSPVDLPSPEPNGFQHDISLRVPGLLPPHFRSIYYLPDAKSATPLFVMNSFSRRQGMILQSFAMPSPEVITSHPIRNAT